MKIAADTRDLIKKALKEDAPKGDITSRIFVEKGHLAQANLIAKEQLMVCGLDVASMVFKLVDPSLSVKNFCQDGQILNNQDRIMQIKGNKRAILKGERVALNFMQHLSGVATATNQLVSQIGQNKTSLLDTRKTLPGLRKLQKYAVKVGGGKNHRMDLSEMVLIKENHIQDLSYDKIKNKIKSAQGKGYRVEIECNNLQALRHFLVFDPQIIMLDNMPPAKIKKALKLRDQLNPKVKFEISGNISAKNLKSYARLNVEYISTGSITHSVKAADISLLIR